MSFLRRVVRMITEPAGPADDGMAEVWRLLGENDAATAAANLEMDHEDALDEDAARREAASNATVVDFTRRAGVQNVINAAALARDGVNPGWDWERQAAELGIDEFGNPVKAMEYQREA
jgi:hypothetical protein